MPKGPMPKGPMPKGPMLAAVVLAMLLSSAGSALAQPGQENVPLVAGSAAPADGSPYTPPPDYVTDDGFFVTGGDVLIECGIIGADDLPPSFSPEQVAQEMRELEEARRLCRAAGFETAPESALTDGLDPSAGVYREPTDSPGDPVTGAGRAAPADEPLPPPPPDYEVTKDGTLAIGGDILVRCESATVEPPQTGNPEIDARVGPELERRARSCREAGFPAIDYANREFKADPSFTGIGELNEDGFIRVSEDSFVSCRSDYEFVAGYAEEYVRMCREALYPPLNDPLSDGASLSDTGGLPLLSLIFAGLLAVGAGSSAYLRTR